MSRIFCIDIGGTRIKGAVLDESVNLEELKKIKVKVIRSLGWLNNSLAKIISEKHYGSLIYDNKISEYDIISIGAPVELKNNGLTVYGHYKEKNGIPSNLVKELKQYKDCEIRIMNDSIAWTRGIHNYAFMSSLKLKYPLLCVILGTGVAIAYMDADFNIKRELIDKKSLNFSNLSKVTESDINKGWKIHKLLGDDYFKYLKDNCYKWTYEKIRRKYTERILALLLDLDKYNIMNFKKVKTVVIGGGNVEYVIKKVLNDKINKKILILGENDTCISPDTIPLLGHLQLKK